MKKAAGEIVSILSAMGANPAPVASPPGSVKIKINAPVINKEGKAK